ncbi:hypothetical protein NDU88_000513 [Pleurodeles waltl]|uniref:Uncharacterized protein n=1 Tax=Pleurodeles waltl TaxID=8319 RepID=A0AAV7N865_PLEWA|nr:hypothetical protein NDU88_000513 [Pleurodeles waltl]
MGLDPAPDLPEARPDSCTWESILASMIGTTPAAGPLCAEEVHHARSGLEPYIVVGPDHDKPRQGHWPRLGTNRLTGTSGIHLANHSCE